MAKKNMTLEEKLEEAIVKDIPYEVSGNWVWTYMGNIGEYINGKAFKPTEWDTEGLPIIRIQNLTGTNKQYNYFNRDIDSKYKIKDGDLLMAWSATLDAFLWNGGDAVLNQHIFKVESVIDRKYHYYLLKNTIQEMYAKTHGTGMVHITKGKFEKLEIPLPPLKEQQRIVDRIESLFEKLDKAKELIEEARERFENRKVSIVYKAISGDLTNNKIKMEIRNGLKVPSSWKWIKFNELGKLERGRSKHRPRNDERLFGGEYPFIQTGDVANSNVYITEHKQTLSEFGLNQSRLFPKGTLCITIAANIGDVAILSYECCFPDSVVGFTPNDDIESKYIYYFLTLIKKDIEHFAPATAQKNINLKILGQIEIPVPSLEEQKEIVRILDKLLEEEAKIEELTQLEEQIELIKKSILAKAFRGELGTNCEDDESALELLKDILRKE